MSFKFSELHCTYCGSRFITARSDAKYCGSTCKQYGYERSKITKGLILVVDDLIKITEALNNRSLEKLQLLNRRFESLKFDIHKTTWKKHPLYVELVSMQENLTAFSNYLMKTKSKNADPTVVAKYRDEAYLQKTKINSYNSNH